MNTLGDHDLNNGKINSPELTLNHKVFLFQLLSSDKLSISVNAVEIVTEIKQILRQELEAAQIKGGK